METLKREIRNEITILFREWDQSEVAGLQDSITDEVAEDVVQTSDYPNHTIGDIRISIKRVVMQRNLLRI